MTRLVTFNILQGAGKRAERVAACVLGHDADIAVLTEFRDGDAGRRLRDTLKQGGLSYQARSPATGAATGVLIAARQPVEPESLPTDEPGGQFRTLACRIGQLTVVGAYFPLDQPKLVFWPWFLSHVGPRVTEATVLAGDFNSGKHYRDETGATLLGPEYLDQLEEMGFVDAWRHFHRDAREYSWYSSAGNGFRLDHVFVSPTLVPRLRAAAYSHREREDNTSDHSSLRVELAASADGA